MELLPLLLLLGSAPQVRTDANLAPGLADKLVEQVELHGDKRWRVGLAVVSCNRDSLLFGYNYAAAMVPASNQKLLVTACALADWDDTMARYLDSLLDRTPTRKHLRAADPVRADSLGINRHPEFPGYRHLVLANRQSDNNAADWMLSRLARRKRTDGHALVCRFLDSRGVPRKGLRIWDGCGLSRRNRASPLTFARLLSRVHHSPNGELFRSTLAVPGQPGTLVRRDIAVGPRVAGKTGFIRDVFALSGYLSAEEDTFAFSFILNGCGSGTRAYVLFDALLSALYNWDAEKHAGRLAQPDSTYREN